MHATFDALICPADPQHACACSALNLLIRRPVVKTDGYLEKLSNPQGNLVINIH
jgi:hypothetical protein